MGSRTRTLRRLLERSQGATDQTADIVRATDAQLGELAAIMAPIQNRTHSLANAHKNLSRCAGGRVRVRGVSGGQGQGRVWDGLTVGLRFCCSGFRFRVWASGLGSRV
jgi:hypothetical protein